MRRKKYYIRIISIIFLIIAIAIWGLIKQTYIKKISFNLFERTNLSTPSSTTIYVSDLGDYSGVSGDVGAHFLDINDGSNVYCSDIHKQLVTNGEWRTTGYEDLYAIDMRNARCSIYIKSIILVIRPYVLK